MRQTIGQFLSSYAPAALVDGLRAVVVGHKDELAAEARVTLAWLRRRLEACGAAVEQVKFATAAQTRDQGGDLSVRGGSHSAPGFGTNDGGVVIDLSPMRGIRVDPRAQTARADGGCTWGDFNHATHAFGCPQLGGEEKVNAP